MKPGRDSCDIGVVIRPGRRGSSVSNPVRVNGNLHIPGAGNMSFNIRAGETGIAGVSGMSEPVEALPNYGRER